MQAMPVLGCTHMLAQKPSWLTKARLGLLVNQASVTERFFSVSSEILRAGGLLQCLFTPQHGYHGDKQANMIETSHGWDEQLKIPILSLYGKERQPTEDMLKQIDILLIDLPDVGTRVYTYGMTMGLCIEAAASHGVKVVILDRPNPIGGIAVEGNLVQPGYQSFVGRYPVPMRHGLTMGELGTFVTKVKGIDCDVEVFPLRGWNRAHLHPDTRLPWFFPSPNMPSWDTALVYPGMVLLEGTNISEGRGTTLPFQLFGAPFLDQKRVLDEMTRLGLEGFVLRPVSFEPVFDKWKGQLCHGFQIHVTDVDRFRPYVFGLALLECMIQVHSDRFQWLPPPYEYEMEKLPIDILIGNRDLREKVEKGIEPGELERSWEKELTGFLNDREACLLYPAQG